MTEQIENMGAQGCGLNTYMDVYEEGKRILNLSHIRESEIDARYLLLSVFGIDMNEMLKNYATPFTEEKQKLVPVYFEKIGIRASRVPLQYITHEQNFCGYDFYVDEHVLVPRMDTEILVEQVLLTLKEKYINPRRKTDGAPDHGRTADKTAGSEKPASLMPELTLLDLCTGSGCIATVLKCQAPFLNVTAADISGEALAVAKRNAKANGADIRFVKSDMFSAFEDGRWEGIGGSQEKTGDSPEKTGDIPGETGGSPEEKGKKGGLPQRFNIITCNPPYIRSSILEMLAPEVKDHEPRMALDGTEDGLKFYRILASECALHLKENGKIFFEIGFDQAADVSSLLAAAGFQQIEVVKDLARLDRVVKAVRG